MTLKPCKLCGATPRVHVISYHVCSYHLNRYHVLCPFCSHESNTFSSPLEAASDWNFNNSVMRCA